jgi:hypothetical protein
MNPVAILERIIKEEGSCCWAKPSICKECPLGQFTRVDGQRISCIEALGIDGLSEQEADSRYKKAATNKLIDIAVNDIIESD